MVTPIHPVKKLLNIGKLRHFVCLFDIIAKLHTGKTVVERLLAGVIKMSRLLSIKGFMEVTGSE